MKERISTCRPIFGATSYWNAKTAERKGRDEKSVRASGLYGHGLVDGGTADGDATTDRNE
jgi:hypothetical protein